MNVDKSGLDSVRDQAFPQLDPAEVLALRKRYWENGYRVLAVWNPGEQTDTKGKALVSPGKQPFGKWTDAANKAMPEAAWKYPDPWALNTGVLCKEAIFFDVDVPVQDLTDGVVHLIESTLGATPLVREGRAPKLGLAYCAKVPFRKIETPELFLPDGTKMQLEVLAEGEQFVADGIHPDTAKPYRWLGGSPATVKLADLPLVTEEQARAICAGAERLLREAGGVERPKTNGAAGPPKDNPKKTAGGGYFAQVNTAALANIAAWAPVLLPAGRLETGTGAWRVSSADLGRDLQEDLSIHPSGVKDHGTKEKLTPIDLVLRYNGAATPDEAAKWLCEKIGFEPERLILYPENPRPSARAFVESRDKVLRCHLGELYEWQGTHYRKLADDDIRSALYDFLEPAKYWKDRQLKPFAPKAASVNNVLDALKALVHVPSRVVPACWLSGGDDDLLLACRNGLLRLKDSVLLPHSPDFFNTASTGFDYDPAAAEPAEWLKFLGALWPDDPDSITALQEQMGYVLSGDTRRHKMFLHVGPPRSGKGTILRILQRILGGGSHVGLVLADLTGTFGLQPLLGKTLGAVPDARLSKRSGPLIERLLAISGGDDLTVARKNTTSVTVRLPVRFWFLTNVIPQLIDGSGTIATRFVVIQYTVSFLGREDLGLEARLVPELPGILNWAIKGWQRLEKQGHFTAPKSASTAVRNMRALTSTTIAFVEDNYMLDPQASVESAKLFQDYKMWFEDTGQEGHPGDETAFGIALADAFGFNKKRRMTDGHRYYVYEGLKPKPPVADENDQPLPGLPEEEPPGLIDLDTRGGYRQS